MQVRIAGVVTGLIAAAVLAGCGSSSGGSGNSAAGTTSSSAGTSSAGTSSAAAAGEASGSSTGVTAVAVTATEFALSLPSTHLSPGTYTFTMQNDGHATHAIALEGGGLSGAKSSTAGPGGSATMTVTLQPGSYTLYCPVGNHRAAGMQTTLTVG